MTAPENTGQQYQPYIVDPRYEAGVPPFHVKVDGVGCVFATVEMIQPAGFVVADLSSWSYADLCELGSMFYMAAKAKRKVDEGRER